MSPWGRLHSFFLSDADMAKKDDDHKPSIKVGALHGTSWHPARGLQRRSIKRIMLILGIACVVYLFIHNIPTDLGPRRTGRPYYGTTQVPFNTQPEPSPKRINKLVSNPEEASTQERNYNGPPKFARLAVSLQAIAGTRGGMILNQNILFAASSLKSAARLLPVACQMGTELKNYVHFALIGRSGIEMEELRKLNGIDEDCQIIFHDARSEYAPISTDDGMVYTSFRALHHINLYMHPQALIIDGSGAEDWFLHKGARSHKKVTGNTLIELPAALNTLTWITKLDSSSLREWDSNHVDILIQATPNASGSLVRLLRSLSKADYTASSIPHLTIDLPHDIDPSTKSFLETFRWPPLHVDNPTNARHISIRHRIPHQRLTEEESSARFLESFWPGNPKMSHILVLSPQVEVAPNFFHFLKYALLEYRHSTASRAQHWDARLFGISLEQPLVQISDDEIFTPPLRLEKKTTTEVPTSFLWQAPTSNAILFLGEKWMELHDFVSRSLEAQESLSSVPELLSQKVVSTRHPSWLEHALRLSRVRGYWTLYPGEITARSIATVHQELRHLPEEYSENEESSPILADDATEEDIARAMRKLQAGSEVVMETSSSLRDLLDNGALQPFPSMPLLTWDGQKTNVKGLDALAATYAIDFKQEVGSCVRDGIKKVRVKQSAQDLFCAND